MSGVVSPARTPAAVQIDTPTDWRSFFELSGDMLCTARLNGWFKEVNQAFADTLGYSREEMVSCAYVEFVHPEDRPATLAAAAALAEGSDLVLFENRYLRKDGSYCRLSWNVRPDIDRALLYCVVRDETARRERDAILSRLLAELERSNADLAQFAYVASHDLSEPLRMVSSYVQLLADRYRGRLDSDADEFIAYAVDGANRMKALIDDLLEFSRANSAMPPRRPVDCTALVASTLAGLDHVITESGAQIVVDDLPVVLSDPVRLSQVFQNLVANAVKFVIPGQSPRVHITADRMGRSWCFSVQDQGIGIAPAHRERIFLMFKRLHARAEYPGTGIGLALCHKIVGRFGGRIWVEGGDGPGSTFRFTIPDADPDGDPDVAPVVGA